MIPRYISGVAGFVDALTLANGNTSVSVQQVGAVIKATTPDTSGKFLLQPVAPGSYTLVMTAPGRSTAVVTNVAVATETVTSVNTAVTSFNPPVSLSGTVNGTAPVDTLVRMLQPLTAGPAVEVAGKFVDGTTDSYSYPLVVNAPLVAPYVAAPGVLVFAPDTAAGKYILSASLTGKTDQTVVLGTLAAGATITKTITFP